MSGDPAADLLAAQDRIARLLSSVDAGVDPHLGALVLRTHQQVAAGRLLEIIGRYRGALLADAVGLGKTYVALAIARVHARPLVICPSALRPMWERAMATARTSMPLISAEALSRGEASRTDADIILIDEAHHFRNPATRRYAAVAELAKHARVLLMSATPMHNSRRDLEALVGLFMGSSVERWPDSRLAQLIVRRDAESARETLPRIDGPHSLVPASDDDCLARILDLPPAIPAADEGTAHALATMSLVHLWASSRGALLASALKKRARAVALRDAIASGHVPTSEELAAWEYADHSLQLAFPFCVADRGVPSTPELHAQLDRHILHVGRLISHCRDSADPDHERVRLLRALRETHAGARIVAFSQYASTVTTLGRLMREDAGVAIVTADGGRIASGVITRAEVLAQFAGDARPAAEIERIELLLTTDLLSEGIDLRGASVIVHLDLPWNPARLEQRVGRARRIGSRHEVIHVYSFVPPAAADLMLRLRGRLDAKLRAANAVVGGIASPLPERADDGDSSSVAAAERVRARVSAWLNPAAVANDEPTLVAASRACRTGWVALVIADGLPRLVCADCHGMSDDPTRCLSVIEDIGEPATPDPERVAVAIAAIEQWLASRRVIADLGDDSRSRRAVLARLTQAVARSPRHRRAEMVARAQRARRGLTSLTGAAVDRVLATLARSPADDEAWLRSVDAFASIDRPAEPAISSGIAALILLG